MSCSTSSPVGMIAHWLVIIGAVNWGLVGLGGFLHMELNVVHIVIGSLPQFEWIVYILVGVSAVWKLFCCCKCSNS